MSANVVCPVLPELLMYPDGVPEGAPLSPCCCTWPVMDGPSRFESAIANLKVYGFRPLTRESGSVVVYTAKPNRFLNKSYVLARMAVRTDVGMFLLTLPKAELHEQGVTAEVSWQDWRGMTWCAYGGKRSGFEYPADSLTHLLRATSSNDDSDLVTAVSQTMLARELCTTCFAKAALPQGAAEQIELLQSLERLSVGLD